MRMEQDGDIISVIEDDGTRRDYKFNQEDWECISASKMEDLYQCAMNAGLCYYNNID